MKTIFFLITFVITMNASAADIIARYDFGIADPNPKFKNPILVTASLNDEGVLKVKSERLTSAFGQLEPIAEVEKELHPHNFENLFYKTVTLSKAKIIRKQNEIVCMIAVSLEQLYDNLSVARDYDYHKGDFLSPMELVQGPQGCWVSDAVYLEGKFENQTATEMKNLLQAISLELLHE